MLEMEVKGPFSSTTPHSYTLSTATRQLMGRQVGFGEQNHHLHSSHHLKEQAGCSVCVWGGVLHSSQSINSPSGTLTIPLLPDLLRLMLRDSKKMEEGQIHKGWLRFNSSWGGKPYMLRGTSVIKKVIVNILFYVYAWGGQGTKYPYSLFVVCKVTTSHF